MRAVLLGVILLFSSACATFVTESDSTVEPKPKSSSKKNGGIVGYNPQGLQEVVSMRRKDALKRIVEYCGSREYEITKEEVVPAGEAQTSGVIASFGANEIREIHFVCKK